MTHDRLKNKKSGKEETVVELTLRPSSWADYIGQERVKANLKLILEAAKNRGESCDHLLFYGQAGLGKTTLAYLVAKEMGVPIKTTTGPALEKAGDIAAILSNLEPSEILFIDEAHRINKLAEEILYPALEARKLHLVIGKGPSAKIFSLDLPPFTVISATTKVNLLSSPLRSRFGAIFRLDYYSVTDIAQIIERSARILQVSISDSGRQALAAAARFTPRVANRLLKRCRDYIEVHTIQIIDDAVVAKTLEMFEIDSLGLEYADRELLRVIVEKFNGGPVGVKALGAALNEEVGAIEEVYEPFLMKLGLLQRTPLGRIATEAAYAHLKLQAKQTLL